MSDPLTPAPATGRTTHLLYLHGFRSSPLSTKAQRLAGWMARHRPDVHWWCPQLPPSPAAAMADLLAGVAAWPRDTMAVVGSSLGGFYATVLAERLGCRAVVINPAVDPARDLARHIGEQTSWHRPEQRFFFRPEFVGELQALHPPVLANPARYAGVFAQGDELLDWREMAVRYAGATQRVVEGSDHALSDFDRHLPFVLDFLSLTLPPCD